MCLTLNKNVESGSTTSYVSQVPVSISTFVGSLSSAAWRIVITPATQLRHLQAHNRAGLETLFGDSSLSHRMPWVCHGSVDIQSTEPPNPSVVAFGVPGDCGLKWGCFASMKCLSIHHQGCLRIDSIDRFNSLRFGDSMWCEVM